MLRKSFIATVALALMVTAGLALQEKSPGVLTAQSVAEIGKIIDEKHVVIENKNLENDVLNAVIKAIDPHGAIMTKDQFAQLLEKESGIAYSTGLKLQAGDELPQISEIVNDSPAEKSGLQLRDIVEKIGKRSTQKMPLVEANRLLSGKKGEIISLTVRSPIKEGEDQAAEPRVVKLTCSLVQKPVAISTEDWPKIGYLHVNGLYAGAGQQIVSKLRQWMKAKKCGAILDLRGANGTDLNSAADIADIFAAKRTILFSVRDGANNVVTTYQSKAVAHLALPVMVITDKQTKNAAETLVAVLQQCKGAMLIGTSTAGDDRIREAIPLDENRVLYIATKRIDPGKNWDYNGIGVQPSVLVVASIAPRPVAGSLKKTNKVFLSSSSSEEERQSRARAIRLGGDPALRRATDILLGLKALNIKVN